MSGQTRTILSEQGSRAFLATFGIPFNRSEIASGVEEAVAAANNIGYPVVLKGDHPLLAHKTEAGVVHLGVTGPETVRAAASQILQTIPEGGQISVQETVVGKREFLAGFFRDDVFGPCVSIALGGIFTEVLDDAVFRSVPFDRSDALAALDDLKNQKLLGTFRGMPAVDREALADVMLALAEAGTSGNDVGEIDLNPLIVTGGRPLAVDALVVLGAQQSAEG